MEKIFNQLANGVINGPDDLVGIGECLNLLDDLEGQIEPGGPLTEIIERARLIFKGLILEESPDPNADWLEVQKLLGSFDRVHNLGDNGFGHNDSNGAEAEAVSKSQEDGEDYFASMATDSGNDSEPGETESSESEPSEPVVDLESLFEEEAEPEADDMQDPELLKDFIEEAKEHLSSIEMNMLGLETNPGDTEAINAVFRPFHSVKGVAGFLNLQEIHHLSHEVENLLDSARSGKLLITDSVIDLVLAATDILKGLLDELEKGEGGRKQDSPLVANFLEKVKNFNGDPTDGAGIPVRKVGEILVEHGVIENETIPDIARKGESEGRKFGEAAIDEGVASTREVSKALREQRHSIENAASVRIDTRKLDNLVDMVGELVIAQSIVLQNEDILKIKDQKLQKDCVQLNRITAEIQRISMSMRMVPIKNTFQKMIRLVRDLSKKSGKEVSLEMKGEETEIDRNMVEEIYEPLVHMIRNSVDHGIEIPQERVAAGKEPTGTIIISAEQKGGNIVIDIEDDGRGLDVQRIREKAIDRGIISSSEQPDEKAIFDMIFHPGFSTKDKVTEVSGRGVGMDVVKKCVERLRGKIEISSQFGKGSAFHMKLPLTMAIIDGMIIQIGAERYIVPTIALKEALKLSREAYFTVQGKGELVKVRDTLMPLIRLHDYFDEEPKHRNPWDALLLVVTEGHNSYCLLADEIVGRQEVVIKSLGGMFRQLPGISGGAILGDGKIALIIDVKGIISLYEESSR
ncbi:CheA signal transduction histidine kinase [Syntrophobacter sp. SbD1]|nr:CheA signal transduction histidine kinase [Syntrophobacter sp. SbD1]